MSRSPRAGAPAEGASESDPHSFPSHVRAREGLSPELSAALRFAREAPGTLSAWDEVEALCEQSDEPEPVADLYLRVLTPALPTEVREPLARRSHAFFERWFGDDVPSMRRVLGRILEACPEAEWAFDALVRVLTVAGEWDELLDAYEAALAGSCGRERRRELLVDAVHAAKDFADRPERAIFAVRELSRMEPGESTLAASLGRTLRERKQWRPLLELWQGELERMAEPEASTLRLAMADIHLAELAEAEQALALASSVLSTRPGDPDACALVGRVLASESADAELRLGAVAQLRLHHDSAGRPEATLAVLGEALTFAPEPQARSLRRELAARLLARGDDVEAMVHYAELLRRVPSDVDARAQLRLLAERSGEHERHAAALIAAAHVSASHALRAELLLSAMRLFKDRLGRTEEAAILAQRVLSLPELGRAGAREAAALLSQVFTGDERARERLDALERLVAAEEHPHARRLLLAEITTAYTALGEPERALAAWDAELERDPGDHEALARSVDLCAQLGRHDLLARRLRQRAAASLTPGQRRRDLVQVAELLAGELDDPAAAIDVWLQVRDEFGDEADVLAALDTLFTRTGRFTELAAILDDATARERAGSLERLCRLGDVCSGELDDDGAAASAYARALELAPAYQPARDGLRRLIEERRAVREAAMALETAYRATDDWELRVPLLDVRLGASEEPSEQAAWMLEIAELCEVRGQDTGRALSLVGRALTRTPLRVHVERELMRLAEQTGRRREAAQALHWAAAVASSDRERAADLSALEARLLESLGDEKGAAEAYRAVVTTRPDAREEVHGLVRTSARAGGFTLACQTALRWCAQRAALESTLLDELEATADQKHETLALRDALRAALDEAGELPAELEAGFEARLAQLCLERCDDPPGAEQALRRALSRRPGDRRALTLLAEVQRRTGSAEIIDTLLKLADAEPDSLAALSEAAERLAHLSIPAEAQREVWFRLYERAAEQWVRGGGGEEAGRWTLRAVERLVALELSTERLDSALSLLDEAARLPLAEPSRARLRAASVSLLTQRGDHAEALRIGLGVLDQGLFAADGAGDLALPAPPGELAFVRALAELAHGLKRIPEEIMLRQRELGLVASASERMALRLTLARLSGLLEARGGRLGMLKANLTEQPGHAESLEAVCAFLGDRQRHAELIELLLEQAGALIGLAEKPRAASLLRRAAALCEERLGEPLRAIGVLEQLFALDEDARALDEMVRLSRGLNDPARTAHWLARKLGQVGAEARSGLSVELARARLAAGQRAAAIATLRAAFDAEPAAQPCGTLLIELLREEGRQLELADVLARLSSLAAERSESLRLAREAARLYHRLLRARALPRPESLVEVSDAALGLAPEDAELCSMMADALSALGRHAEARQVLVHSLAQFGRRRSPERAAVHVQLAEVHRAEGELARACAELELALTMKPDDAGIINALAERAGEAGDLLRRERALRALYLVVKRGPVQLEGERVVGVCEVLFALSEVSAERGDQAQAATLRESALAALRFDDPELVRVKRALAERGVTGLLEHILREELSRSRGDVARAERLAELADLLERDSARRTEALALRREAVGLDPSDPRLHEAALASARALGEPQSFAAQLEQLRERLRRPGDVFARCEVCLRLGALRLEAGDLAAAQLLYAEAESTGVRESDVWRAQLELAIARDDRPAQETLLKQLGGLGGGEIDGEGRVDVLYRLAEIRLGAEATRAEGLTRMREIIAEHLRPLAAARLILRARAQRPDDPELLALLRAIADASGELDLLQMAELCGSLGDEPALDLLLEVAAAPGREARAGGQPSAALRAALLVQRARMLATRPDSSARVPELLRAALALREDDAEAEALLLAHYRSAHQPEEAQSHLQQRFERALDGGDKEACARYALALHELEGTGPQALTALRAALRLSPQHPALRAALIARISPDLEPLERARAIEQALESAELREPASFALEAAELYRRAGDGAGAARVLSLGRQKAPRSLPLLRALVSSVRDLDLPEVLAELLEDTGQEEETADKRAACFREAAKLNRLRLGDHEASMRLLERAVSAVGSDAELRRELADELTAAGRAERAIEHLAHAAAHAREPERRAAHLREKSRLLVAAGDLAQATVDLEEAMALWAQPRDVAELIDILETVRKPGAAAPYEEMRSATLRLARARRVLGEREGALALLDDWLAEHPDDDQALTMLTELHGELDRPEELARLLSLRLSRAGDASAAGPLARELVALLPRLKEPEKLRAVLEKARELRPSDEQVETALADFLTFAGDHRGTASLLLARAARSSEPTARIAALKRAAEQLLSADAIGEAAEVLVELRGLCPGDVDLAVGLTDRLLERERFGDARLLLEVVADGQSDTPAAARARLLVRLARAARGQGDADSALGFMLGARETDKANRSILGELAVLAEELGSWETAEKSLTSLLLLNDQQVMPRSELLLRRARVARQTVGPQKALMWARKAVEAAPDSADASALLKDLESANAPA
jgi:hypothetical protein